jgi:hypothetical protein
VGHSLPIHSAPVPANVRYASESDHSRQASELTLSVESRCGAVALGRTYLLPPLSSGGALMVPPWLRFHIPLIEPDRQISRIRLSDKTSRLHFACHVIVFGQAHLRRILGAYAAYYNESRIHRSLNKDAPFHRAIERLGAITSYPILGGLHHQYCRI